MDYNWVSFFFVQVLLILLIRNAILWFSGISSDLNLDDFIRCCGLWFLCVVVFSTWVLTFGWLVQNTSLGGLFWHLILYFCCDFQLCCYRCLNFVVVFCDASIADKEIRLIYSQDKMDFLIVMVSVQIKTNFGFWWCCSSC